MMDILTSVGIYRTTCVIVHNEGNEKRQHDYNCKAKILLLGGKSS